MEFNQLLAEDNIDPATTLVLRHRPREKKLREKLGWLAERKPEVFNAYQQTQTPRVERQMMKANHVASFIGDQAGRALFVAVYKNRDYWSTSLQDRRQIKACCELANYDHPPGPGKYTWFDLVALPAFNHLSGRLIIEWPPPEISWSRWSGDNSFTIQAIREESLFAEPMPDWRELVFEWNDLEIMPPTWRAALREWRGIYHILDVTDGMGYVGAAYGRENIMGRWQNYAKNGHGNNKLLRKRKPENLRFSILERMGPDAPKELVIERETSWKIRLHTREFGLNEN